MFLREPSSSSLDSNARRTKLAKRTSLVAGAVACTFSSATSGQANADLVEFFIGQTVSNSTFHFDLNQDGANDFIIEDKSSGFGGIEGLDTKVAGVNYSASILVLKGSGIPRLFSIGESVLIGTDVLSTTATLYNGTTGPWGAMGTNGYLGLSIKNENANDDFFGWIELTRGSAIVGRAGFQTTAETAALITVPEPSGLALLAIGGVGLAALRRRRRTA